MQPELDSRTGEGYTPHMLQAWEQHTAYIDCCLVAGIVSIEAKDSFIASLKVDIEASGGEIARHKKADEDHAANLAKAAAKKEAIERQSLLETLRPGKGDGKGHRQQQRYTAITKNPNENASVAKIAALAVKANAVEVVAS